MESDLNAVAMLKPMHTAMVTVEVHKECLGRDDDIRRSRRKRIREKDR
jgi:hypothetical protein